MRQNVAYRVGMLLWWRKSRRKRKRKSISFPFSSFVDPYGTKISNENEKNSRRTLGISLFRRKSKTFPSAILHQRKFKWTTEILHSVLWLVRFLFRALQFCHLPVTKRIGLAHPFVVVTRPLAIMACVSFQSHSKDPSPTAMVSLKIPALFPNHNRMGDVEAAQ